MSEEKLDQLKGNVKETAGNLTKDKDLEKDGQNDKNEGKAKEFVDQTANKAKEVINKFNKN